MRRALARVDGSATIGMGHVMRCLTLADGLREVGFDTEFVMSPSPANIREAVASRGFAIRLLGAKPGTSEDAREVANIARSLRSQLVIVDGYHFKSEYLALLDAAKLFVCFVDDLSELRYDCAAVLNHNLYAPSLTFDTRPGCELLLGAQFALVRTEFVDAREKAAPEPPVSDADHILVIMGGSDPTSAAPRVLKVLSSCAGRPLDVRVLVGAASCDYDDVDNAASAEHRHRVKVLRNVKSVAEQMLWCDIAITAAGITCMELACVGVPAIVIAIADNQLLVAQEVHHLGLMRSVPEIPAIASAVDELRGNRTARASMIYKQRTTVDGNGRARAAVRIVSALEKFEC